jgi:hypothetical protein
MSIILCLIAFAATMYLCIDQGRVQHEIFNVVRTKNVQQVLSVIKHALFNAIVNREGTDNSDVNIMLKTMYNKNSSSESGLDSDSSSTSIENGLLANKLTALIRNKDIDEALKVSNDT